jgi:hypoxanthine phosphoribosyltransferase
MGEREVLTWDAFGTAGRELAQQVVDDGFRPDLILTIARGGLIPAGALGYALDVKNLVVVNVEFYTGVDQRLDVPVFLPPVPAAVDLADRLPVVQQPPGHRRPRRGLSTAAGTRQ